MIASRENFVSCLEEFMNFPKKLGLQSVSFTKKNNKNKNIFEIAEERGHITCQTLIANSLNEKIKRIGDASTPKNKSVGVAGSIRESIINENNRLTSEIIVNENNKYQSDKEALNKILKKMEEVKNNRKKPSNPEEFEMKLREAVKDNNITVLKELLALWQCDGILNMKDKDGMTLLHICAKLGHLECFTAILYYSDKVDKSVKNKNNTSIGGNTDTNINTNTNTYINTSICSNKWTF
jgi:hypothetical protein